MNKVDAELLYKRSATDVYNRVIKIDKVNVCKIISDIESYPPFRHQMVIVNISLHGNVHKCPYKTVDIDEIILPAPDAEDGGKFTIYPNGFYISNIIFWNRNKFVGMVTWSIHLKQGF